MGIELGRISGPLLAENLLRNGIDLAFEDNLLYLDVNNNRIGIRKDNPGHTLDITGTTDTTNLIVDTNASIGNLVFNTNLIQNVSGSINIVPDQTADPVITATQFGTFNLRISDRLIENITADSNINISPNGTGKVVFNTDTVNVDGDLHATGNITWDGSITFGNSSTDNIAIISLINSNLIPQAPTTLITPTSEQLLNELLNPFTTEDDQELFTDPGIPYTITTPIYDLGSVTNKWKEVNLENLTATNIVTDGITAFGINLTLRIGNTWYVSKNGLDTNYGDHLHATFLTVKQALSVAESGDEIVIFPGVYEEAFPLLVPEGVTVHGNSIRAVTITPTELTKDNDAFLLHSGATVENLTVKDYYYNALDNTGYAFKFAPGYVFNGKSPYVRNISVITKNSGLDLAGRGSLVDSSGPEDSMLFHSVTFITPGAKALVITNGVRVEWLNSFTYFASVGVELTAGAELRSINSANIYGDYGVTADGNGTVAYLVGHNFSYIGSGLDSTNDPINVIQANEVVEINGSRIYYDSVDNTGNVRIGNIFHINQQTGQIAFDASDITFTNNSSMSLASPSSTTLIRATYVQTGNVKIYDNIVKSLTGPVNLTAQSGSTYFNTDVFVTGNLAITDNVKVKGNVYLGDNPLDLITIVPDITQDIIPDITDSFTLGTDSKRWNKLFVKLINVDNVTEITNNTISTLTTDTDLKFAAAGTGEIHVATTNVQIDNNLTTNTGTATIATLGLSTTVTAGTFNTGDVTISNHTITTNLADSDLELSANGIVSIPSNPVKIDQTLTVNDLTTVINVNIGTALNPALLTQIGDYTQTGDRTIYGNVETTGNTTFNGEAQFYNININTNVISTTLTDTDLLLQADGAGIVQVKTTDVQIDNDLTVGTNLTVNGNTSLKNTEIGTVLVPAALTLLGNLNQTGNTYITGLFANNNIIGVASSYLSTSDIKIDNNSISVLSTDNDLTITGATTGSVVIENQLKILNNTISNVRSDATTDAEKSILFSPNGTGNTIISSTKSLVIPVGNNSTRLMSTGEIRFNNLTGLYEGAISTGLVSFFNIYDSDRNTYITPELTLGANDNTIRFGVNGVVRATITPTALVTPTYNVDNVSIESNTINSVNSSTDLNIETSDAGNIVINDLPVNNSTIINSTNSALILESTITSSGNGYIKFGGTGAVVFPYGPTEDRRIAPELGETRYNSTLNYMEVFDGTGWIAAAGGDEAASLGYIEETLNLWSIVLG